MSDLVRNESYIGKKYNFVGTVLTDLILETIGKVYIKQLNKMTRLDLLVELIINKHQAESPIIILGEDLSIPLATYPGEGVLIYDPINLLLYITYNEDYMMLVDTGGKEIYVKLNGDTMTGLLLIELEDTTLPPLVVNTNVLVENLNSLYLNGYSSDDFLRQDTPTTTIQGDWTFNKTVKTNNGIQSSRFISGCNGSGFYISNNGDATVNNLTVRGTLSECNPSSSGGDYEELPEYISNTTDGDNVIGNWLYIPEDTVITSITVKETSDSKFDYTVTNGGNSTVYSLYKYGVDDTTETPDTYIELFDSSFNIGEDDENILTNTVISRIFNGNYYKLVFPDEYPTHLSSVVLTPGFIYKYYKYTDLNKYEAEYYCFIILNKVTCADGTTAYIVKMSRENLLASWFITKDCDNNISCTIGAVPDYITMSTDDSETTSPCTILTEPLTGIKMVSWGILSSSEANNVNNTYIVLGSNGLTRGYLTTRIYPSFATQNSTQDYTENKNATGLVFSTGLCSHPNQEGDWYATNHPKYSTYNHYLISENTSIRTATGDINKTPPEGALYTYTQQGYIIDDGMIKHFHRTKSNECMANRDGYLSNGILLNKDGKLGYIGNLTDDSLYESNIIEYHNRLITNNETVVNHTTLITSILELLTQLNLNLTLINTKIALINEDITSLKDRVTNLESGTSGDLSSLRQLIQELDDTKLSRKTYYSENGAYYNGSGNSSNNIEYEYTIKIKNRYIKYGVVRTHDDGSRGVARFIEAFPIACYSVVISGQRDGKGADGHNYVYNISKVGFDYLVDNCPACFIAIGY